MSDDNNFDQGKLLKLFEESQKWSSLLVTIDQIAEENKKLVRDLEKYNVRYTVPLLAGLLTVPEYQSNCIRLEILVVLAVRYCSGKRKANIGQAVRWFNLIGKSKCAAAEDPAEDVFVSLVIGEHEDYRIIEGVWEAAGFYTDLVYRAVNTMPKSGRFGQIRRNVHAILKISDIVCEKAGLNRYQIGSEERHKPLSSRFLPGRNELLNCVTIPIKELEQHGIKPGDIEPFLFDPSNKERPSAQRVGDSNLEQRPFVFYEEDKLTVTLPSALSVALRDFVIAEIIDGNIENEFDQCLAILYKNLLSDTPLLGGPMNVSFNWRKIGQHRISEFAFEVDDGFVASFHLFLPSVSVHLKGGFKENFEDDGTLTTAIQLSIDGAIKSFEKKEWFRGGLVLLIGCGWGKGYATEGIKVDHPKWRFEHMAVADLVRLSWLGDMNPGYFWRIQDGLEAVKRAGVEILNPNGILNLIGFVRENDGHFVPHSELPEGPISPEAPLLLNPPINLLRNVRMDSDLGYDRHGATDESGKRHLIQYTSPNPFFKSDTSQKLYSSLTDAREGKLTSVYEGHYRLWLQVEAPHLKDSDVTFRLWEMGSEWLHRIGGEIDNYFSGGEAARPKRINLIFKDSELPKEFKEKSTEEALEALCTFQFNDNGSSCEVILAAGFLKSFSTAENIAERVVARKMLFAFLKLLKIKSSAEEIAQLEKLVVPNNQARSFHLFQAREFLDFVRHLLPKELVTVDSIENGIARLGLAWRVRDRSQGNIIRGQKMCTGFLNKIVDALISDIRLELKSFNRKGALLRIVSNIEKASAEEDHWKRTSAALLGLHGETKQTIDQYVLQVSKFAGAGIGSRVLAEMAVCVCPTNSGRKLSDIELTRLISKILLVVQFGGISDAIRYNALPPELTLSPLGDILFKNDFGRLVVEPMLSEVIGNKFLTEAPLQTKNYEDPTISPEIRSSIDSEFWEAWKEEMGFDLDQAREIIGAIEDKAIEKNSPILVLKRSEFLNTVCVDGIDEKVASHFLEQFTVISRPNWDKPPKGFELKDIYPWRFGRRLSFVSRPILQINEEVDYQLIIPPASLRKSFAYLFDGAFNGRLEQAFFKTSKMKDAWWGQAREGHTFEKKVARVLEEAGWCVRVNIGVPELLNSKTEVDFGDIDVLAWRNDTCEILVIECKDLQLARNYSEIASLLSEYQGEEKNGKPDKLKKHLNRVSIVNDNSVALTRFTQIQDPKVFSWLCCSGDVPMQYTTIEALKSTTVGSISDLLKL
ncbi:hypothetical protein [Sneathiella sp.]|uniref:hypothetical protein n=1 Tax=Sneathiella sp. TaxID=1964365 RepID=UPI00356B452A